MRRWQFAAAVGAPLCLPLAGLAQETAPKVVAYLGTQSPEPFAERVRAFVQGLAETGQIEGRESELARRQPAVIVSAGSVAAARAAKAATTSIPIALSGGSGWCYERSFVLG